jgi:hypothetical protein
VRDIDDVQLLEDWLTQEKKDKNRKGAIEAIEQRFKELKE